MPSLLTALRLGSDKAFSAEVVAALGPRRHVLRIGERELTAYADVTYPIGLFVIVQTLDDGRNSILGQDFHRARRVVEVTVDA